MIGNMFIPGSIVCTTNEISIHFNG